MAIAYTHARAQGTRYNTQRHVREWHNESLGVDSTMELMITNCQYVNLLYFSFIRQHTCPHTYTHIPETSPSLFLINRYSLYRINKWFITKRKENSITVSKMIQDVWTFKQKRCPYISKNDSIFESWKFIGPIVASRFGGSEFIPVPYLFDADAYRIGHVFVPAVTTKVTICLFYLFVAPTSMILRQVRWIYFNICTCVSHRQVALVRERNVDWLEGLEIF